MKGKRLEEPILIGPRESPVQDRMVRTAVLIPAFNEERTIAKVVLKAQKYVDHVIVCDDGSKDMTGEIARCLGAEVIRHDHNQGYGAALSALFARVRQLGVEIAVTLDGDDQHDPAYISDMIRPIVFNEADVVVGTRFKGRTTSRVPVMRKAAILSINRLTLAASGKRFSDTQSGMRAYRTKILPTILPTETGMGASTEILVRASDAGLRVKEVGIPISYAGAKSTHNPIVQGLDVVGATLKHLSIKSPLKFYGVPSIFFLANGIFFGIWAVDSYIATRKLIVNLTVISLASAIMGLILGTTAVILYSVRSIVREQVQQSVELRTGT